MADIVSFNKYKASKKYQGNILCLNGHHKWKVWKAKQFDVKKGRLITVYRCERCNAQQTESH